MTRQRAAFSNVSIASLALACIGSAGAAAPQAPAADEVQAMRSQLRWVPAQRDAQGAQTLDMRSRLLLARSAAQQAALAEVGLDWRDVYGVIHAETSWVPRTGMGRNGVMSHGLAQFEPATARAVGLRDPHDPVAAVHAAAQHLKEAAAWSARRLQGLRLGADEWARRLREGISIYYNLSTAARNRWNGLNSHEMPLATRLHMRNMRIGAMAAQAPGEGGNAIPDAVAMPMAAERPAPAPARAVAAAAPRAVRYEDLVVVRVEPGRSITYRQGEISWSRPQAAAPGG